MNNYTEEYPLGGTVEPWDIEREKELTNMDYKDLHQNKQPATTIDSNSGMAKFAAALSATIGIIVTAVLVGAIIGIVYNVGLGLFGL